MKRLAVLLALTACTEPSDVTSPGASDLAPVGYDTARFAYQPSHTALEGCGFSLGMDPSWELESRSRTDEKGDLGWMHAATFVNVVEPSAIGGDVLRAPASVSVSCLETTMTAEEGRAYLERYTRNLPGSVAPATVPVPGTWWRSVAAAVPGGDFRTTVVTYASIADGIVRIVRVSLPERRASGVAQVVPAGGSLAIPAEEGGELSAVVGRATEVGADSDLSGIRTTEENVRFAEAVVATMR